MVGRKMSDMDIFSIIHDTVRFVKNGIFFVYTLDNIYRGWYTKDNHPKGD